MEPQESSRHTDVSQMDAERLAKDLVESHGEILQGEALRKAMGYRSKRTLYRAIAAGDFPVSAFKLPGQSIWSVRTRDVAVWLASLQADTPRSPKTVE